MTSDAVSKPVRRRGRTQPKRRKLKRMETDSEDESDISDTAFEQTKSVATAVIQRKRVKALEPNRSNKSRESGAVSVHSDDDDVVMDEEFEITPLKASLDRVDAKSGRKKPKRKPKPSQTPGAMHKFLQPKAEVQHISQPSVVEIDSSQPSSYKFQEEHDMPHVEEESLSLVENNEPITTPVATTQQHPPTAAQPSKKKSVPEIPKVDVSRFFNKQNKAGSIKGSASDSCSSSSKPRQGNGNVATNQTSKTSETEKGPESINDVVSSLGSETGNDSCDESGQKSNGDENSDEQVCLDEESDKEQLVKDPYGITQTPCTVRNHQRKTNCTGNPNCLFGLGEQDKVGVWGSDASVLKHLGIWPNPMTKMRNPAKQPAGLKNLGATCYINALMQCLFWNPEFRSAVYKWIPADDQKLLTGMQFQSNDTLSDMTLETRQNSFVAELQRTFAALEYSKHRVFDLKPLTQLLDLQTGMQQDAGEFNKLLLSFLDRIFQQSSDPDIKELTHMFRGTQEYVTECTCCGSKSKRREPFFELELHIREMATVSDSLKAYGVTERLDGANQYQCDTCQAKRDAERYIQVCDPPKVLNLQLIRFAYDLQLQDKRKIKHAIRIPNSVDLAPLVNLNGSSLEPDDLIYDLVAVLHHHGSSAHMGHYTADVLDQSVEKWFHYNDENVTELKLSRGSSEWYEGDSTAASDAKEDTKQGDKKPRKSPAKRKTKKKQHNATKGGSNDVVPVDGDSDLEVDEVATAAAGAGSRNAYMLVYRQRSYEVSSAKSKRKPERIVELLEAIRSENESFEAEKAKFETESKAALAAVEARKELYHKLFRAKAKPPYVRRKHDKHYWIPTDWLTNWIVGFTPQQLAQSNGLSARIANTSSNGSSNAGKVGKVCDNTKVAVLDVCENSDVILEQAKDGIKWNGAMKSRAIDVDLEKDEGDIVMMNDCTARKQKQDSRPKRVRSQSNSPTKRKLHKIDATIKEVLKRNEDLSGPESDLQHGIASRKEAAIETSTSDKIESDSDFEKIGDDSVSNKQVDVVKRSGRVLRTRKVKNAAPPTQVNEDEIVGSCNILPVSHIKLKDYVCVHAATKQNVGYLHPSIAREKMKRVSPRVWNELSKTYGYDLAISHENFKCSDCLKQLETFMQDAQNQQGARVTALEFLNESVSSSEVSNSPSSYAWVSKSWIRAFKAHCRKEGDKLKALETVEKEKPLTKAKQTRTLNFFSTSMKTPTKCDTDQTAKIPRTENVGQFSLASSGTDLNSDLVCAHGLLKTNGAKQAITLPGWAHVVQHAYLGKYRKSTMFTADTRECETCLNIESHLEALKQERQSSRDAQLKSEVYGKTLKALLRRTSGHPSIPSGSNGLAAGTYYVVPISWMTKWRMFMNQKSETEPEDFGQSVFDSTLCGDHQHTLVPERMTTWLELRSKDATLLPSKQEEELQANGPTRSEMCELLLESEWEALSDVYNRNDTNDFVHPMLEVSDDNGGFKFVPEYCHQCARKRTVQRQREVAVFSHKAIFVQQMKHNDRAPSSSGGTRRRGTRTRTRGKPTSQRVMVSSKDTLNLLCLKLLEIEAVDGSPSSIRLYFEDKLLEDKSMNLEMCGITAGSVVKYDTLGEDTGTFDVPDLDSDSLPKQSETGFRNTVLSAM